MTICRQEVDTIKVTVTYQVHLIKLEVAQNLMTLLKKIHLQLIYCKQCNVRLMISHLQYKI